MLLVVAGAGGREIDLGEPGRGEARRARQQDRAVDLAAQVRVRPLGRRRRKLRQRSAAVGQVRETRAAAAQAASTSAPARRAREIPPKARSSTSANASAAARAVAADARSAASSSPARQRARLLDERGRERRDRADGGAGCRSGGGRRDRGGEGVDLGHARTSEEPRDCRPPLRSVAMVASLPRGEDDSLLAGVHPRCRLDARPRAGAATRRYACSQTPPTARPASST